MTYENTCDRIHIVESLKTQRFAEVSELADEQDSGSCERYAREGSSPFFRMIKALADARAFFLMFLSIFQNVKIIHINIKILHL